MNNLTEMSILELKNALKNRQCSVTEVTKAFLQRIDEVEPKVDAFLAVTKGSALERAKEQQKVYDSGVGIKSLTGIPIGIKDIICTKGITTTAGSRMLSDFVPPYDATVVEKINDNGGIIVGKTNCDEFAMGSSTERSAFKTTKNPWDLTRIPGGSSGGSAAAVASGMVPCALGTDTGGSVRQPAALCGIVGIKPTYGLVSRYGLIAFASSFDQVGVFARNISDTAAVMNAIMGYDEHDSTSILREKEDYDTAIIENVKDIKIGIPREFFAEGLNSEIREIVFRAVEEYRKLGAVVEECSLDISQYSLATYYIIACAEASSNLARFDGIRYGHRAEDTQNIDELYKRTRREGFGEEVKRRIFLGTCVLSSGYSDQYYAKAQKVRNLIRYKFARLFEKYDFILTPTSPCEAFKFGEKTADPLEMYLADIYTIAAPTAGIPAISIPCGFTKSGLPVGLQLMGNYFSEGKMLRTAYTYEQSTQWAKVMKPTYKGE